jgi:hypothetical protein
MPKRPHRREPTQRRGLTTAERELSTMAESGFTVFNIETLNALGARLRDVAAEMAAEVVFDGAVRDIRLAVQVCDKLASLRFAVNEIANHPLSHAVIRRDLHIALRLAEDAE